MKGTGSRSYTKP